MNNNNKTIQLNTKLSIWRNKITTKSNQVSENKHSRIQNTIQQTKYVAYLKKVGK